MMLRGTLASFRKSKYSECFKCGEKAFVSVSSRGFFTITCSRCDNATKAAPKYEDALKEWKKKWDRKMMLKKRVMLPKAELEGEKKELAEKLKEKYGFPRKDSEESFYHRNL